MRGNIPLKGEVCRFPEKEPAPPVVLLIYQKDTHVRYSWAIVRKERAAELVQTLVEDEDVQWLGWTECEHEEAERFRLHAEGLCQREAEAWLKSHWSYRRDKAHSLLMRPVPGEKRKRNV